MINKYIDLSKFKEFVIKNGNLEWNDGEMLFYIMALYLNDLTLTD